RAGSPSATFWSRIKVSVTSFGLPGCFAASSASSQGSLIGSMACAGGSPRWRTVAPSTCILTPLIFSSGSSGFCGGRAPAFAAQVNGLLLVLAGPQHLQPNRFAGPVAEALRQVGPGRPLLLVPFEGRQLRVVVGVGGGQHAVAGLEVDDAGRGGGAVGVERLARGFLLVGADEFQLRLRRHADHGQHLDIGA